MLALPASTVTTREALRAVACFAVSPARRLETGRIGLEPIGDGFGTPPFGDGTRIVVDGDELIARDGRRARLTTVRAAAELLGVDPSPEPGVGHDLPPYQPDVALEVDPAATRALAAWWHLGRDVLDRLAADRPAGSVSDRQLWPEHFDLAAVLTVSGPGGEVEVNVGASAGDAARPEPYLYVGPHDVASLDDPYWGEPFGAALARSALIEAADPVAEGLAFVHRGLELLAPPTDR